MKDIVQKITSEHIVCTEQVRNFIYECVHDLIGIGFHPDTPFSDYIDKDNGNKRVFTKRECHELDVTFNECLDICKKEGVDIYELTNEILLPVINSQLNVTQN